MVRYGTVLYGMGWYGMVWYGMVWYGMVWYGTCFRTYLFEGALLDKTLTRATREDRPDTVVEVWARSVHSGAWQALKVFFGGSG